MNVGMTFAPSETLQHLQDRLGRSAAPARIIEDLLPRTRADAVAWVRRLPLWDEYRGQYPDQVVALARVISRRAMREFDLAIGEDGRVLERVREGTPWNTPAPALTFPLAVGGEEVRVEYTREYFPRSGQDHFYFVSPHTPPRAHPLSETGYLSQFIRHDTVEACGGPHAYAALFAEARLRGEEQELAATFEGRPPEGKPPRRKRPEPVASPAREQMPPAVVLGEHTAAVVQEQLGPGQPVQPPPRQGMLF
jgi:hypothetical protein